MDLELSSAPQNEEAQRSFSKHKETYEKLRADVTVKMQFLDENRVSIKCSVVSEKILNQFPPSDQSDAQAAALIPQRHRGVLLGQRDPPGGNHKAVQHQKPQHDQWLVVGAVNCVRQHLDLSVD